MSFRTRLVAVVALWFIVAMTAGSFGAFVIGGHGSIVYLLYAVPLAMFGCLASVLSLSLSSLRSVNPWLRFGLVALVATFPILAFTLYGVVTDESYPLTDAVTFMAIFAAPTVIVAGVAELVVHGHFPRAKSAV